MLDKLQYWPVALLVRLIGILPRPLAHAVGILIGKAVYYLHPRLRRVGLRNLELAFPDKSLAQRRKILRGVYVSLGRLLGEACLFPSYTPKNASEIAVYQGFENFQAADNRGKGVLLLTGHFGGWEVGSFFHSLQGHPMQIVVRPLDNPYVDALVMRYRGLHGNTMIGKQEFARGLIAAMRKNKTVGILMDTNMTPPQGAFVDFFGISACTATGLAHVARKTGAAVLPGFMLWEPAEQKYVLRFGPEIEMPRTAHKAADILEGTRRTTAVIEAWIRRYPDQWLWIHRRWKTRPAGETGLY